MASRDGSIQAPRQGQRRLALLVLLGAAGLAAIAFPFRATWWGGWLLAVAEAGVVGGLADWFAVTALFRHPLGLPIPHTALIPRNWELMAARVGSMVGDRVLTTDYVTREIARVDVADLIARAAARLDAADLEASVGAVVRWVVDQLPPAAAAEIAEWSRRRLLSRPLAPLLADIADVALRHEWDQRLLESAARALAGALERPEVHDAVADLVDQVMGRYRERMGVYPRFLVGVADALGLIDRGRLVAALHAALLHVAEEPADPLRRQLTELAAELPGQLRAGDALAARVEAARTELLESPALARIVEEAALGLTEILARDLASGRSEIVTWLAGQLEHARAALASDASLRRELDAWIKARAARFVDRYQDRVAAFIERGVHGLGPEGAVRLIEDHAGDDLQYVRVNGTVVGGIAGGAIYAVHLLLRLL